MPLKWETKTRKKILPENKNFNFKKKINRVNN